MKNVLSFIKILLLIVIIAFLTSLIFIKLTGGDNIRFVGTTNKSITWKEAFADLPKIYFQTFINSLIGLILYFYIKKYFWPKK